MISVDILIIDKFSGMTLASNYCLSIAYNYTLLRQREKSYINEQVNVDNFFVSLCLGGNI
jgi:hypothetical protein